MVRVTKLLTATNPEMTVPLKSEVGLRIPRISICIFFLWNQIPKFLTCALVKTRVCRRPSKSVMENSIASRRGLRVTTNCGLFWRSSTRMICQGVLANLRLRNVQMKENCAGSPNGKISLKNRRFSQMFSILNFLLLYFLPGFSFQFGFACSLEIYSYLPKILSSHPFLHRLPVPSKSSFSFSILTSSTPGLSKKPHQGLFVSLIHSQ